MPELPSIDPSSSTLMNPRQGKKAILPELLAPAGDWDCVRAAVENGADAVYFGLSRFNARMRAKNFTESDLPALMEFLHRRGVRGYVTFNTLVFTQELPEAEEYLRAVISAGVDAAIVQDVGICRLIRRLSADFPIHASTQMTITSGAGIRFAQELGCHLVVLARECSIAEIEKLSKGTSAGLEAAPTSSMPLEVFVHGALCVAYSGQCLTSEALGGRSANRGECAQACRMPYDLLSDGKVVPLGDRRYLLSPQDLAGIEVLPELVRAGVSSLKIEGRLKSPDYVASVTRIYREALDRVQLSAESTESSERWEPDATARYDLEMSFSRGLYPGWFRGINNQELVHARFGKKRGVYLGEVRRVSDNGVHLVLCAPLKPGDGIVFDAGTPDQDEEGGRVYQIDPSKPAGKGAADSNEVVLRFGRGCVDFQRLHVGDKIWKTNDPHFDRRVRQTFSGSAAHFRRPIRFEIHGHVGQSLTVIARDDLGHVVQESSAQLLSHANKRPLTAQVLEQQLGRLGGSIFRLAGLDSRLEGDVLLPLGELNRLRRTLVERLETLRAEPTRWTLAEARAIPSQLPRAQEKAVDLSLSELTVLVRNLVQLEAVLKTDVRTVYCEFEDPKKYREAVERARSSWQALPNSAHGQQPRSIFVAPPRVFKTGEEWILDMVRSCKPDGFLVRAHEHLEAFPESRRIGDFSLNIANPLSAEWMKERFGLELLTASYDLNFEQLCALLAEAPPEWFEITIHQHMPLFHMEHCVFCAFMSKGKDFRDCGRPCEKHDVRLRDRVGAEHSLRADAGCRNTVFNSVAQTGAEYVHRLQQLGVRHFRLEFLNDSAEAVAQTVALYSELLRGNIAGEELWRQLKLRHQLGVTRGQMERG